MKLTITAPEQLDERITSRWGDLERDETLFDLIRAEVSARSACARWTLLQRLARALGGEAEHSRDRLRELCDALEYEGDFSVSSGGVVHSSPLRAIRLDSGSHRLVSSLPCHRLRPLLPGELVADGVRRIHRFDPSDVDKAENAVRAAGGVVLSPEDWAGLDLAPVADSAWLDSLDQRLGWESKSGRSLDREGALDWQCIVLTDEGPRWRRSHDEACRLWRARTSFGRWVWAWAAAGQSPSNSPFASLTTDEASRTLFAVAREAERPVRALVVRDEVSVRLGLRERLPWAEYRYLTSLAAPVRVEKNQQWSLPLSRADGVLETLCSRLGLEIEGDLGGEPANDAPSTPSEHVDKRLEQPLSPSLVPSLISKLLDRLQVKTYADLLQLDLEKVASMPGVGRKKFKVLKETHEKAASPIPPLPEPTEPCLESELDAKLSPIARTPYDDWSPEAVFGRFLPKRARNVLETENIGDFASLHRWYNKTEPNSIKNYGKKTYQQLGGLIRKVLNEGYDSLHFGGNPPASVADLARRYLASLEDRSLEFINRRFVERNTLEEIGGDFGLTRERVRQVEKVTLEADRATWGQLASELLDPFIQALDQRGGIALTSVLEEKIGSPERWVLNLCLALSNIEVVVDVIPGVTTTYSRLDFSAVRALAIEELQARIDTSLEIRRIFDIFEELGVTTSDEEMEALAKLMLRIVVEGDRAYLTSRSVRNLYIRALYDAAKPLDAQEVARRVDELDPNAGASLRSAVLSFARSKEVLHYERGAWIHREHLPISREELDHIADLCFDRIQEAGGVAISVRSLLQELVAEGRAPENLSEYTLCDAIRKRHNVRGWWSGVDLAWLGADVSRKSIREWVAVIAPSLEQPFLIDDLAREISNRSGQLESSAFSQCMSSEEIVHLGGGNWVAREAFFAAEDDLRMIARIAYEHLPLEGVISSASLSKLHPLLQETAAKLNERLLWGVGKFDERIVTKERGALLWRADLGQRFWNVTGPLLSQDSPVLSASTLADWLSRTAGWDGNASIARGLLQEGENDGWLLRIGIGWYVTRYISDEEKIREMSKFPQLVRLAMGSQDYVRESPALELLNEMRSERGLFRVLPG